MHIASSRGARARRALTTTALTVTMAVVTAGTALAHNPPGDPLPVRGEPTCFGARVSHSASQHGLTPKAKIAATQAVLENYPGAFPALDAYYEENGVSVRTIQNWIRTNCSDEPLIDNPGPENHAHD